MIVMTDDLLNAGACFSGMWTRRQLEALGVSWPLVRGWRTRLIGSEVSEQQYQRFLRLSDKHDATPSLPGFEEQACLTF